MSAASSPKHLISSRPILPPPLPSAHFFERCARMISFISAIVEKKKGVKINRHFKHGGKRWRNETFLFMETIIGHG